jgi:hypothetical protein
MQSRTSATQMGLVLRRTRKQLDATMPAKTLAEVGSGMPGRHVIVRLSCILPIAVLAVDVGAPNGLVEIPRMLQYQQRCDQISAHRLSAEVDSARGDLARSRLSIPRCVAFLAGERNATDLTNRGGPGQSPWYQQPSRPVKDCRSPARDVALAKQMRLKLDPISQPASVASN